jgi:hypothetical protein
MSGKGSCSAQPTHSNDALRNTRYDLLTVQLDTARSCAARIVIIPPSGPRTFLPGTAVVKDAAVFDLKPGDRTDLGVLRLTSR